jgi:retron-type reverse transcriptase
VSWILDADYRSFFDTVSHEWLVRFLEHRVGDDRVIRLIRKWLCVRFRVWGTGGNTIQYP